MTRCLFKHSLTKPNAERETTLATGQSLIESCIVMAVLCLLFMGMFQVSQLFMAQEILNFASARGARAKSVGFNSFMVRKTVRVGTIANAGRMLVPDVEGGPAQQRAIERSRIPLYLGSERHVRLSSILDYEDWADITHSWVEQTEPSILTFRVFQRFPLRYPFHRTFHASDSVDMRGEVRIDNHYPLYLDTEYSEPEPDES
jgi:hypothetical protein